MREGYNLFELLVSDVPILSFFQIDLVTRYVNGNSVDFAFKPLIIKVKLRTNNLTFYLNEF